MFYIHKTSVISAQQTLSDSLSENLIQSSGNKLRASDAGINDVPLNLLRRMGKAVKLGIGTGMHVLKSTSVNGIIIGTGNGGLEDCIKFLNQIIDYDEGRLTPTNFVQSTTNAIAAQLGIMNHNTGYNITHVHRGLAFENALIDVGMLLKEHPANIYLTGGVDEISDYNYAIDFLTGSYKKEIINNKDLYQSDSAGTVAGEGAAMFIISNTRHGAFIKIDDIKTIHTNAVDQVTSSLRLFLVKNSTLEEPVDLFLSGENGDFRLLPFYSACEKVLNENISVLRFKHMTGEFPSVSALALKLACDGIQNRHFPEHMYKKRKSELFNKILIYNTYKGEQHSFIIASRV